MRKINVKQLEKIKTKPSLLDEYVGQIARIETIEEEPLVFETQYGTKYAIRILTETITTLETKEGEVVEIKASEIFNLAQKENGELGYSEHPDSKLQKFMNKQKVKNPVDLIGTRVKLKMRSKEGKNYLGYETK